MSSRTNLNSRTNLSSKTNLRSRKNLSSKSSNEWYRNKNSSNELLRNQKISNELLRNQKSSNELLRNQASFILRSTHRRGLNGEKILEDRLKSLGESYRIKGSSDVERVACSLEVLKSKNLDGMKFISDYIDKNKK